MELLNRPSTWTPVYAGVTVKDSHMLPLDIDTLPLRVSHWLWFSHFLAEML